MNKYICSLVAFLFGTVTACTDIDTDFRQTDDPYTTITVTIPRAQAPSTRSIADGNGEAAVTAVDLLVFENTGAGETLAQHIVGENITSDNTVEGRYKVKFRARLGTNPNATTIAIVANAASRISSAATIGSSKATVLAALTYVSTGTTALPYMWKATSSTNYTPIPMYGEYSLGENGITHFTNVENVELIRMLARIDVVNNDSNFTITNVRLVNYQTAGYIAPAWNTDPDKGDVGKLLPTFPTTPMIPSTSVHRTGTSTALLYTATVGTIYTYEAPATTGIEGTDGHTNAMCLIVQGTYQSKTYYYRLDFTDTKDAAGLVVGQHGFDPTKVGYIPVSRNHHYSFTLNEVGPGHSTLANALSSLGVMNNLKVSLMVVDESLITDFAFNDKHYIGVESPGVLRGYAQTKEILITTNYTSGWSIGTTEYEGSTTGWLTTKKGTGDAKHCNLQLTTKDNLPDADRTAYVTISAGLLTHKLKVTQKWDIIGSGTLVSDRSYVGAFWRHNQRGERLIRIPVTNSSKGTWSVQVLEYGKFNEGDIMFDTTPTADPYVTYSENDNHIDPDDGKYYVDNGSSYVSGNAPNVGDYIYFRVGLKNTIGGDEHRYSRIILSYANNTKHQAIYLRQGEAPDYLMAPGDPTSIIEKAGSNTIRTTVNSKKFAVYNLTSSELNDVDTYTTVQVRNGIFTQYPTQAGAHFQFVNKSNPNIAYHPTSKLTLSSSNTEFEPSFETCPPDYVRPDGGSVNNNNFMQSFTLNPELSTSYGAWGYYADGYFDRLAITNSVANHTNTSVRAKRYDVGYIGRLIVNPVEDSNYYNASIFFPGVGYRTGSTLDEPGNRCNYWSRTDHDANSGYRLMIPSSADLTPSGIGTSMSKSYGMSIRCILE